MFINIYAETFSVLIRIKITWSR